MSRIDTPGPRRTLCTLLVALAATAAGATQSRPVNIEEMTERAATIFAGRCLNVRNDHDRVLGHDVTVATFRVDRSLKGNPGQTITVRMPWAGTAAFPAGVPVFQRGDDVVLFLYGESRIGMRSTVGLGQGRFRILKDKQGRPLAINDVANRNLMMGVSARARERLAGVRGLSRGESLRPDDLIDAIRELLGAQP